MLCVKLRVAALKSPRSAGSFELGRSWAEHMYRLKGAIARLPWVWGLLIAALVVGGLSSPAAAARYIAAPLAIHRASAPVEGHHFDLSAKHHRAVHHATRRFTPNPLLAASETICRPSLLERLAPPSRAPPLRAVARQLPPQTGPPLA
jgi:hypothetical protein